MIKIDKSIFISPNTQSVTDHLNPRNDPNLAKHIDNSIKIISPLIRELLPSVTYSISESKVYVIASLGLHDNKAFENLWDSDDYFSALAWDYISTKMLFELTDQFYTKLKSTLLSRQQNISMRMSPGDNLPLSKTKDILDFFESQGHHKIKCNDAFVITTPKVLVYYYDFLKDKNTICHDRSCHHCNNKTCFMRSI